MIKIRVSNDTIYLKSNGDERSMQTSSKCQWYDDHTRKILGPQWPFQLTVYFDPWMKPFGHKVWMRYFYIQYYCCKFKNIFYKTYLTHGPHNEILQAK